jgi:hypothetical protein
MVFGFSVSDPGLEKLLCPEGMGKSDRRGLAEQLTDAAAQPGAYSHVLSVPDRSEVEVIMDGVVAMAQQYGGRGTGHMSNQWKQERKNTLAKIKSKEDLIRINDALHEAEHMIEAQQVDRLRVYMQRRYYADDEITTYVNQGGWIRIVKDTTECLKSLFQNMIHLSSTQGFENGFAEQLNRYHSEKLTQIRVYSPCYSIFLLRTYAYLRDAKAKRFNDVAMFQPILQGIYMNKAINAGRAAANNRGNGGGGNNGNGNGDNANTSCSWCKSRDLHSKYSWGVGVSDCALKKGGLTRSQAAAAAKAVLAALKADPQADKAATLKKVIGEHKG